MTEKRLGTNYVCWPIMFQTEMLSALRARVDRIDEKHDASLLWSEDWCGYVFATFMWSHTAKNNGNHWSDVKKIFDEVIGEDCWTSLGNARTWRRVEIRPCPQCGCTEDHK